MKGTIFLYKRCQAISFFFVFFFDVECRLPEVVVEKKNK